MSEVSSLASESTAEIGVGAALVADKGWYVGGVTTKGTSILTGPSVGEFPFILDGFAIIATAGREVSSEIANDGSGSGRGASVTGRTIWSTVAGTSL